MIMKLLLTKNSFSMKLFIAFLFFGMLYGCQKTDQMQELSKAEKRPAKPSPESADFVYQWYKLMAELQLANPAAAPPTNFRNFAYIGVGLFESVQPGINGGSSLSSKLYEMPAMPKPEMSKDYLWSASANAALSRLFKLFLTGPTGLTTANVATVNAREAANYNQFKTMASEEVLQRSRDFGYAVAQAIYDWSLTDGFIATSVGYVPPVFPGAWVPTSLTPQGDPAIAFAYLGDSRPFLKYTLKALAPPIPIPYSEDPSSAFYQAAKEVYDIGKSQNPAQMATARYWADVGGVGVGYPGPYHLLSIVTEVLESHLAGLWKAAEVYAKTGIALKDGPIITFRSKFYYNLVRPITYIQNVIGDKNWTSLLVNPAYPEYISGLMGSYGPVIEVLINEFGDVAVTDDVYTWRGLAARQFSTLSALREEAAISRLYGGLHYMFTQDVSIQVGIELGDQIDKVTIVGPEYQ
jgi:hypothetical protein